MKLKNLFYLLLALPLLAVACTKSTTSTEEPTPEPGPQPENPKGSLTVVETSIEVAFYGGDGEINYSITDGAEGALPEVTPNADWVTNIEVGSSITFTVELNDTTEERLAIVVVKYGETSKDVFVRQAAGYEIDVEFEATALNGEYYGTKYSQDPNYFAILSKNGTTGWSDLYIDTYYRLDIYAKTPTDAAAPVLPQGIYAFDYLDAGVGDTFGNYYSVRMEPMADGNLVETKIEDGVVIVTENRIEAIIKFVDGKTHRVVYEGALDLGYLEFPEPEYYSTLSEDYSFEHNNGTIRFFHYGDYYGLGASNWTITMMLSGEPLNGDYFLIDLVADSLSTTVDPNDAVGTYTCVADESQAAKNVFFAGGMDGTNYTASWMQFLVDNYVDHSRRAPLSDGTVTVVAEGTGYRVTLDCVDDNGHKIQGSFNCPTVEIYDNQNEM